jgi:DNA topoisomerase-1
MSFILIITEKPQAAQKISHALADGSVKKVGSRGAYWLEFSRNGKKHICVPAVGHLFVLDTKESSGWTYPVFDVEWVPTYTNKGSEFTKKYLDNIIKLKKDADTFIVATDFDVEGEVIGYNILKFACGRKDGKRMKFSTLTKSDLEESYDNLLPHIEFGQAEAGLTRHYLDFFWGINITRALTLSLKSHLKGGFVLVSSGRVQSPTLKILAEREAEIKKFKPKPYWQLELHCVHEKEDLVAQYEEEKIWDKEKVNKIKKKCHGKDAKVKDIEEREYKKLPPFPLDTTTMQTEAYNNFKFSLKRTMSTAESLYNAGLISYPRTSSQEYPKKIGFEKIIKKISKNPKFKSHCEDLLEKKKLSPRIGKKKDPAHPAIYPTGDLPKTLTPHEKKLYDMIVSRFLSTFGDHAVRKSIKIILDVNGYNYILSGKRTIKPGWTKFYQKYINLQEQTLPKLAIGQVLKVKDLILLSKKTQPPNRYTPGSIVKQMEKLGLGTKATRANIVDTLYERGYIKEKQIEVTKFGESVIDILKDNSPKIISEEMTAKFEKDMEAVRNGKKKRETVLNQAKHTLNEVLDEFEENKDKIGKELSKAYIYSKKQSKILGKCPSCGHDLKIVTSKRTGKRFVGCSNYPKCHRGYPLPQHGKIKPLHTKCKVCGLPEIQVFVKGKKPYMMCINHECKTKDNWKNNSA